MRWNNYNTPSGYTSMISEILRVIISQHCEVWKCCLSCRSNGNDLLQAMPWKQHVGSLLSYTP